MHVNMLFKSTFLRDAIIFGTNPGSDIFSREWGDTQDSTEKNELPVWTELSVQSIFSKNFIFFTILRIYRCPKTRLYKRYWKYYDTIWHILQKIFSSAEYYRKLKVVWTWHVEQILTKKWPPGLCASLKDNLGPEHSGARDLRLKFDSHSVWLMAFVKV